jgi:hypothetical protein
MRFSPDLARKNLPVSGYTERHGSKHSRSLTGFYTDPGVLVRLRSGQGASFSAGIGAAGRSGPRGHAAPVHGKHAAITASSRSAAAMRLDLR